MADQEQTIAADKQNLYLKTALLAGELLIRCNAEAYRVEETVQHILWASSYKNIHVNAQTTSFQMSVEEEKGTPITFIRRITERTIDLYRIHQVNHVSRHVSDRSMSIEEAYARLLAIQDSEYSSFQIDIATVLFILLILILFQGTLLDLLVNIPLAVVVVFTLRLCKQYSIQNLLMNFLSCTAVAVLANVAARLLPFSIQVDLLIISCIMPLVPGIAFTNGVRDIFRGDYSSGFSKLLEAIMVGIFIALGTATGLLIVKGVFS
ncbi:MAG TPA: threonine/serine exporter family protein [Clostridiaceae bacterium]|nr:threonine/serine exporter family protein [Clostridiaceae bacterium]